MRDVLLNPMQKFVKEDMNSDVLVRTKQIFRSLPFFPIVDDFHFYFFLPFLYSFCRSLWAGTFSFSVSLLR